MALRASQVDGLKEGRNRVIETGHTLVLGWSDKFVPLAREIANAAYERTFALLSEKKELAAQLGADVTAGVAPPRPSSVFFSSGGGGGGGGGGWFSEINTYKLHRQLLEWSHRCTSPKKEKKLYIS